MLKRLIKPFLTRRFMKFAAVGASGVVVNLGTLAILRAMKVHTNLASALAIEVSILSNFAINHLWTFGDRRHAASSLWRQGAKFHLVSLGGGVIQFITFVFLNVIWLRLFFDQSVIDAYGAGREGFVQRWVVHPIVDPPDEAVGNLVYLSQLIGIGTAMVWNYLLNFYWTWAHKATDDVLPADDVLPPDRTSPDPTSPRDR